MSDLYQFKATFLRKGNSITKVGERSIQFLVGKWRKIYDFWAVRNCEKKNYICSAVTKAFVIPVPFFALIFFVEIKFMFAIADPR